MFRKFQFYNRFSPEYYSHILFGRDSRFNCIEIWRRRDSTYNRRYLVTPYYIDSQRYLNNSVYRFKGGHDKNPSKVAKPEGLALRGLVYQRAKELTANGHSVTLQWVPGHSMVKGNERADSATNKAADRRVIETDCWSSLTHVKTYLNRSRLAEISSWHQD